MGTVTIRFRDKDFAFVRQSAAECDKNLAEYCRDVILNGAEASAMSTDKVKDHVDAIQRQVITIQKLETEMMKRIFVLSASASATSRIMLEAVFENQNEKIKEINEKVLTDISSRYKKLFGEEYNPNVI